MELFSYLLLFLVIVAALLVVVPLIWGAVWLPTPNADIKNLLKAAELKEGETLFDLGCGDGRLLFTAVRDFGAKAVGVEIDPFKVLMLKLRIKLAGLSGSIKVIWSSAQKAELKDADLLFIYLSHQIADSMLERFKNELKSSARVVSYSFMVSGLPIWKVYGDKKGFIYKMNIGKKLDRLL